eukprot:CAMPEP_0181193134 /NCGR_PEP_ID=MMETSP1096-20121128/13655_1 /TAXON_ID=156174 ORGANISM="Chrysochromulina ericina, Strain CCMP281" /NCGR_SAMPLE_ID=MMETSP1096 /ASSEMBLY_ACC=CAM_ASM_000453 /LENGTH=69 /DNA_ID=CAMNT_0023282577 /DNA_START=81 /DNA_END=290 /DNA_ORIENTATION=-
MAARGYHTPTPATTVASREPTASRSSDVAPSALLTHLLLTMSSDPIGEVWGSISAALPKRYNIVAAVVM